MPVALPEHLSNQGLRLRRVCAMQAAPILQTVYCVPLSAKLAITRLLLCALAAILDSMSILRAALHVRMVVTSAMITRIV